MNTVWPITMFGDSGILVPLALALALWVASRSPERAIRWLATIAAAMILTTVTKVIYGVTGKPISAIDFRMISGHMVLSFSVWPVLAYAVGTTVNQRVAYAAAGLAVIGCAIIGYTRLYGFHTLAEVIVGSLLGGAVALTTLRRWRSPPLALPYPPAMIAALCVLGWACYGYKMPTQAWIDATSAWVRTTIG